MNEYTIDDIHVGLAHQFEVTIKSAMLDDFCRITGDVNPMHTSEVHARARGFEHRVVYGMLTASFYSTLAGVHLPGRHCVLQGVDTTFNKPVYPGDDLTVYGEVVYINQAYKQIEIKAHISNQDGAKVSKAKIRASVNG